ncbi:MAG TPA: hypothetical protein V6D19_03875, partial [Stenomitos sp.]
KPAQMSQVMVIYIQQIKISKQLYPSGDRSVFLHRTASLQPLYSASIEYNRPEKFAPELCIY